MNRFILTLKQALVQVGLLRVVLTLLMTMKVNYGYKEQVMI